MIIVLEIALLIMGVLFLIGSFGIEDLNKRMLSAIVGMALFILLMTTVFRGMEWGL